MTRKPVKARALQASPARVSRPVREPCRVETILREVASIRRVLGDCDKYRHAAFPGMTCGVTEVSIRPTLQRRERALEQLALTLSATSEVGAVFQLMLAYNASALDDEIERACGDGPASETHRHTLMSRMESIQNATFSALVVLVRKVNDPDLKLVWKPFLACDAGDEERAGAAASAVVRAAERVTA
jgi:hypothetical protein